MNIFITGSSGFICRNLTEYFQSDYVVLSPSHGEMNLLETDSVRDFLEKNQVDIIIHAANINPDNKKNISAYDALNGNLRMFFNLASCNDLYKKMFYFGSGAEYDMRNYVPDMKEEYFGKHIPMDAYGFSKYIMSNVCDKYDNIWDLRLFGVYGKYEEWHRRFISNAICRVLKGKDITIQKNVYFDYLWIDDLCNIMQWFIKNKPEYRHYNVCRGVKIDLYSLACMIRSILNADCDIVVGEPGWKPEYTGNNERLLREVGNYSFVEFEASIRELSEYYKANIDLIDENRLI